MKTHGAWLNAIGRGAGVITVVRDRDADVVEFAQSETLESRLVGLKQYDGSHIELCPVEHLLLLSPGHGLPTDAQRLAANANDFAKIARAYLTERQARERAAARREQLLATLAERQFFLKKGFDYQESSLAAARATFAEKARSGNKGAELDLSKVKKQQRELGARRTQALALIEREPQLIGPGDVWFIAHALVIPTTDREVRGQFEADVERVAMQRAWRSWT